MKIFKNNTQWLERGELIPEVMKKIKPVLVGLDIGVGIVPHDYLKSVVYVCCEPYKEYVDVLAEKISNGSDRVYIIQKKDWAESIADLKDKSIDALYLIDVVEHLPKKEGEKLLKLTERVVRKQIVIFTPLGFVKQEVLDGGKDAWGLSGAEYQEHKSGWMPEDFDETWNIYACKDFHDVNNVGEKLEKPFGAFWAIKNFGDENNFSDLSFNSLSSEIKEALFNQLPCKYFEIIKKLEQEKLQYQQLQSEHQQLQSEYGNLINSKTVRYSKKVQQYLRKIGIEKL